MNAALTVICAATALLLSAKPAWSQAPPDSVERSVYGTLLLGFMRSEGADLPKPPVEISIQIEFRNGERRSFPTDDPDASWTLEKVNDSNWELLGRNFTLSLPPGSYSLSGLACFIHERHDARASGGPNGMKRSARSHRSFIGARCESPGGARRTT